MFEKRLNQSLVIALVILALFYLFRADILNFLNNNLPASFKAVILRAVEFIYSLLDKLVQIISSFLKLIISAVLNIISNLKSLYNLLKDILNLLTKPLTLIHK